MTKTEESPYHSPIPTDQSLENIPKVSSHITPPPVNVLDTSIGYKLPFKHLKYQQTNLLRISYYSSCKCVGYFYWL